MTTRPAITQAVAGFPASDAWWLAQVYNPLVYLYNYTPQVLSYTAITANTSTTTTTELVAITTPSITFQNGRAYRITYKGLGIGTTTGDNGQFRVRKTNTSGTAYIDGFRTYLFAGNTMFNLQNICANNSGADITAALVGTYALASGGGTVAVAASTNNVAYILVEDMGISSNFTNATAIT
ncbi:hypothetical protein AB0M11_08085 [Streptomyces sp. NPDC051987]|uniref:hypothetical protein n=1 Tax=Streptomyces sp. NPDC051987 TaxID=3155808 RepID=UPI00342F79E0